jgi:hypothetical protein
MASLNRNFKQLILMIDQQPIHKSRILKSLQIINNNKMEELTDIG